MIFSTKGICANNMVLLQNETNCIFGSAAAESLVNMDFRGKKYSATTDKNGEWKIEFNPGTACKGEKLILSCESENIVFEDVAVGEVWLCSGQSNMQLTFDRLRFAYPEEFKLPENDNIRMITIPVKADFSGEQDSVENPVWAKPSPETLASMGGTAYFFAKKIQAELGVPVGIINASQGGIPITAMMNAKSFEVIGDYKKRYEEVCKKGFVEKTLESNKQKSDAWNKLITGADEGLKGEWQKIDFGELAAGWTDFSIPGTCNLIENAGIVWFKKEFELTENQLETLKKEGARIWLGTIRDADTVFINGVQVGITYYLYPPRRYAFDANVLKVGKNTVTIRVQQNCKWGKIHFFLEKPYAITSENVKIAATVARNVERKEGFIIPERVATEGSSSASANNSTSDNGTTAETENSKLAETSGGVYIPLSGNWKCKVGCQVENSPSTVFVEYEPSGLYNAMLAPCFNTAIRGAVWYQGESNALGFAEYEQLLCNMIDLWREKFSYAVNGLPFIVVQLPNWANDTLPCANPVFADWALLRETQFGAVQKRDNTAISVLIDAGEWNDLHPEKKLTGGTRTAEQALRLVYKRNYPKPAVIKSAEISKDEKSFNVKFDSEVELVAYKANGEDVDFGVMTKTVEGFGVLIRDEKSSNPNAGSGGISSKDANFVPLEMQGEVKMCEAVLSGNNTVEVKVPDGVKASEICEVRYLWANCPVCVNMYAGGNPVMPGRIII